MNFSRATLATFSDALTAFYAAPDAAVSLPELNRLFSAPYVSIEETGAVAPNNVVSFQKAAAGSPHVLSLDITVRGLRLTIRRDRPFTEQETFLAHQLLFHLVSRLSKQKERSAQSSLATNRPATRLVLENPQRLFPMGLTRRESEVLHWVMQGKRDAEIANTLGSASKTVSKHVENILRKFDVENRLAAAQTASEWLRRQSGRSVT